MFLTDEITTYFPYIAYGTLGILLLIQLYYIIIVYGKLSRYKTKQVDIEDLPPVSVIICAYNEQDNLKAFLPTVLEQDYPEFEAIVVNDCSDDETKWILKEFESKYSHLKVVEIQEHVQLKHIKKFVLTIGIKATKYNNLVLTDADCQPASNQWLRGMASPFSKDNKEIVLGYSPYFKESGFLNKLIRFETTHTAMSYLSYALQGNAYMGVGRNLAYTKDLFYKGKGFNTHMHIKSGDDDLFVNHNATKTNVAIAIDPDEHTYSIPKSTWKSYYKQKARHAGASVLYKKKHKSMLATQLVSAVLFYVALFACLTVYPTYWQYALGAYLLRLTVQLIVYSYNYKKLGVRDLLIWLPILDILFYFYICINGLFNRNKKQTSWK